MSNWQPIETAPKGKKGYAFMRLAWDEGDEVTTADGLRWGDRFFAAATFYRGGHFTDRQYELREIEVSPTHWMPPTEPPEGQS